MQELIRDIRSSAITVIGYQCVSEYHLGAFLSLFSDYHRIQFVGDITKLDIKDYRKIIIDISMINFGPRSNAFDFKTNFISFISKFPRDRNLILTTIARTIMSPYGTVSKCESEILYRSDIIVGFQKNHIEIVKNRLSDPSKKYNYSELRNIKINKIIDP